MHNLMKTWYPKIYAPTPTPVPSTWWAVGSPVDTYLYTRLYWGAKEET
jgi:hypothetical protein